MAAIQSITTVKNVKKIKEIVLILEESQQEGLLKKQ